MPWQSLCDQLLHMSIEQRRKMTICALEDRTISASPSNAAEWSRKQSLKTHFFQSKVIQRWDLGWGLGYMTWSSGTTRIWDLGWGGWGNSGGGNDQNSLYASMKFSRDKICILNIETGYTQMRCLYEQLPYSLLRGRQPDSCPNVFNVIQLETMLGVMGKVVCHPSRNRHHSDWVSPYTYSAWIICS